MSDKVTLRNTSRFNEQIVRAANGDSFQIQPRATVTVDAKFAWNLPAGVVQVKARTIPVQVEDQPEPPARGLVKP